MKKCLIVNLILIMLGLSVSSAYGVNKNKSENDIKISNRFFSINLPNDTKGTYITKKRKNGIFIYHKDSHKAGFGGLAFGIMPFKNPADHSMMPGGRKIGELTDNKGTLYDMVLIQPTDVQHDYTKSTEAPKAYKRLYDLGENVVINDGKSAKYHKNQGMKGENLYKDVLKKHITAINKKWDSDKLEKENMSYMYSDIAESNKNALDKVGYVYYDLNGDGIEELLVGEIAEGEWKGVVYDIYTMVDRKPRHVVSGGERNRYYACDGTFVCNEYSSSAFESGVLVYILVENSTELFPQVSFKYDNSENSKKPWFIAYSDGKWDNVDEKTYNERKKVFDSYERFNFTPLSKIVNEKQSVDKDNKKKRLF